jgi:hypothetical protein
VIVDERQRLRQVTDQADLTVLKAGGLDVPTLFQGSDGNYWVLAEQFEAWRSARETTGKQ